MVAIFIYTDSDMRKRLLARDNLVLRSLTARMGNYFLYLSSLLIRGRVTHAKRGAASGTLALQRQQLGKIALTFSLPLALFLLALFSGSAAMQQLDDHELSEVTGQALMQMAKTPGVGVSNGLTFYRAGLDAVLELNLNIDKLQLGCGGINGPGCDIDIDHLGLSGPDSCPGGRPGCSAMLTRPFFEFAIKNDDKPGLREIVGIRMSAQNALGLLTAGQNTQTPNGINVLSGYMTTAPIQGVAQTVPMVFGGPGDPNSSSLNIRANLNIALTANLTATTNPNSGTGIFLQSLNVPFSSGSVGAVVNGNRVTSTSVGVTGNIPTINLPASSNTNPTTELIATVSNCSGTACGLVPSGDLRVYSNRGSISGLRLAANFTQDLGYIHRLEVNSPFSLSFQEQQVWWPDAAVANVSQPGWWMAFDDPVDLGPISPRNQVDISSTFPQLVTLLNNYFQQNPLDLGIGQGWTALTGGYMNVDMPNMNLSSAAPITIDLTDLPLGDAQNVVPNCWGGAQFC